jgi:hypothetical protein
MGAFVWLSHEIERLNFGRKDSRVLRWLHRELAAARRCGGALRKESSQLSISSPRLAMHQAGKKPALRKLGWLPILTENVVQTSVARPVGCEKTRKAQDEPKFDTNPGNDSACDECNERVPDIPPSAPRSELNPISLCPHPQGSDAGFRMPDTRHESDLGRTSLAENAPPAKAASP